MMRRDPSVIHAGEIRDQETAEMAVRAAMTGHQVYSTLHTNSSIAAMPRLMDLGVLPDIMAGNIIGVIAQRLVRKLCPQCKKPYTPDPVTRRLLDMTADDTRPVYQAAGCARCDNIGFKGRVAIMELFKLDAEIDELIARRATRRGEGLPHARRRRDLARHDGPDQPRGDLARGRPDRPRDLSPGRWRFSLTGPWTPTAGSRPAA